MNHPDPGASAEASDGVGIAYAPSINGILWSTARGEEGLYLRDSRIEDEAVRRITLVSKKPSDDDVNEEEWLVFSRRITNEAHSAGEVQVAVLLDGSTDQIQMARNCTLFARFATGLERPSLRRSSAGAVCGPRWR